MNDNNLLNIDSRPSDSPLVETVWRSHSHQADPFLSIAASRWEMIVSRYEGRVYFAVRGPETRPTLAHCPPEGEWMGIQFKHGVFMPQLPVSDLVDNGIELPEAANRSFWFHGSAWEFPTFENAETFVARLLKNDLLVVDPVITAALEQRATDLSPRSVQRRFLRATGLTHGTLSQIERAHQAVALLRKGVAILDVVDQLGYSDQPHLTHSLKRLIGLTPAQLVPSSRGTHPALPLSFSPVIAPPE